LGIDIADPFGLLCTISKISWNFSSWSNNLWSI